MQVVLQSPSELVVHDSRWTTAIMGAVFMAAGGGFMWLRWSHPDGWSGNGGPWVVYVVGSMFVAIGAVILWMSADRRYIIDRGSRTVSIVVQRLVHQQRTELAFNDIDDVALEESAGMSANENARSSPTWRVVFLMKNGSRVPWTPYLTSARASQETCAAAVRIFGGWTGSHEHDAKPTTATPPLISHPIATNWGCLAAFLSIFVAAGLGLFSLEVYRVATYRPIAAMVYSTGVEAIHGTKGVTYKPVVSYGFTYGGRDHYSTAVLPITVSAGLKWAQDIASRYRQGSVVTAYMNPGNPDSAFLIRKLSLIPLIFVLVPVLFGLVFAWTMRVQRSQVKLAEQHLVPVLNSRSDG